MDITTDNTTWLTYPQAMKIAGGYIPDAQRLEGSEICYYTVARPIEIEVDDPANTPHGHRTEMVEGFEIIEATAVQVLYSGAEGDEPERDIVDSFPDATLARLDDYLAQKERDDG